MIAEGPATSPGHGGRQRHWGDLADEATMLQASRLKHHTRQ